MPKAQSYGSYFSVNKGPIIEGLIIEPTHTPTHTQSHTHPQCLRQPVKLGAFHQQQRGGPTGGQVVQEQLEPDGADLMRGYVNTIKQHFKSTKTIQNVLKLQ